MFKIPQKQLATLLANAELTALKTNASNREHFHTKVELRFLDDSLQMFSTDNSVLSIQKFGIDGLKAEFPTILVNLHTFITTVKVFEKHDTITTVLDGNNLILSSESRQGIIVPVEIDRHFPYERALRLIPMGADSIGQRYASEYIKKIASIKSPTGGNVNLQLRETAKNKAALIELTEYPVNTVNNWTCLAMLMPIRFDDSKIIDFEDYLKGL